VLESVENMSINRAIQPLTDGWKLQAVEPRRSTLLGLSYRTPQVEALGLDAHTSLDVLLAYPFQLVRLGSYWNRIEPEPGRFITTELDRQIDAVERAGKQIILCVGPLKTFSYPEFFVPPQYLPRPFPERSRIKPDAYPELIQAATDMICRLVERYRSRQSIVAWQLEHEAVDPLGREHSWRLDSAFVEQEFAALRGADPVRPIMMNGFLPTSLLVTLSQWWQTRDQGDSLALAGRMADIVGIDYYPRHALLPFGARTLYLDGTDRPWALRREKRLAAWIREHEGPGKQSRKLMVAEGQAEPWEAVTTPPNPAGSSMYSCPPEQIIQNYNTAMRWPTSGDSLYAYLFWGAEYWLLRQQTGDPSYLSAFARIVENS
jgi:hypothetical protein